VGLFECTRVILSESFRRSPLSPVPYPAPYPALASVCSVHVLMEAGLKQVTEPGMEPVTESAHRYH
jgi:hypothetical protein